MGLGSKNRVPSYEALLLLCCVVTCGCYLGSHMRIPVVPLFARTMGADTFQVGTINASFLLMAALLSLPLGVALRPSRAKAPHHGRPAHHLVELFLCSTSARRY